MPETSAKGDGKFSITLCLPGGGTNTILMDLTAGVDHPSSSDHFNTQDCPYGIVITKSMMPAEDAPALVGFVTHRPTPSAKRNQALPPLPALGPPLGSRAPPANLG